MKTAIREPAQRPVGAASTKQLVSEEEYQRITSLLGYKGTSISQGQPVLAAALRELDIAILDPQSVRRYKRQRLLEAKLAVKSKKIRIPWEPYVQLKWNWTEVTLPRYRKNVPITALMLAARIAEKLPAATFLVEELRCRRVVIDPFLLVSYRGARYYIAHWDEPGFED